MAMRRIICGVLSLGLLVGCTAPAGSGSAPPTAHPGPKATGPATAVTVAPDLAMAGHVVRVNATARYAILGFPIGSMPLNGLRMGVYREGRRVGEVKVSGPQRDDHTVADIMQGDCQVGDEVRDR